MNKQTVVYPFNEILLSIKRNELLTQTSMWMDLKTIMLTESRSVVWQGLGTGRNWVGRAGEESITKR